MLVLGDEEGRIAMYNLASGEVSVQSIHQQALTRTISKTEPCEVLHRGVVNALQFVPHSPFFFSGGIDASVCLHEVIGSVFVTRWRKERMEGSVQCMQLLPELELLALSTSFQLSLWVWSQQGMDLLASWYSHDSVLDPICFGSHGFPLVAGDWDGNIHVFEMGTQKGLNRIWSKKVSDTSLLAMQFVGEHHVFAVAEEYVCLLIDLKEEKCVASSPFFTIGVGNRKTMDLVVRVHDRDLIAVNPVQPQKNGVAAPLYLVPLEGLTWKSGKLYFDKRELL
jgi:WD40 repeat protein